MPDKQNLEEKTENTELENILFPFVDATARVSNMRQIMNDYDTAIKKVMQDYVSALEHCEKETGETYEERTRKVGYHTALITNEQQKKNVETTLEALCKLMLVQISDKITSVTRITACHQYDKTEAHPRELHTIFTGCFSYKITDYGKSLLEEHRKIKGELK
ncbi:hypothetical protein HY484_04860 [Candidatus Woesearchaeota archaeon]|nr:hypothetical protein [Candidatus Woesearchaeota archaeon]